MKYNNEKGSVLILTIMAVLILSVMVTGLLNVGTTEIYTTRNYQLTKAAYYTAVQGAEEIRSIVANAENDSLDVQTIKRSPTAIYGPDLAGQSGNVGTTSSDNGMDRSYMTGTLVDLENSYTAKSLEEMRTEANISTPDPVEVGTDLSKEHSKPVVWHVYVTSQIIAGNLKAYSEVIIGILQRQRTSYN